MISFKIFAPTIPTRNLNDAKKHLEYFFDPHKKNPSEQKQFLNMILNTILIIEHQISFRIQKTYNDNNYHADKNILFPNKKTSPHSFFLKENQYCAETTNHLIEMIQSQLQQHGKNNHKNDDYKKLLENIIICCKNTLDKCDKNIVFISKNSHVELVYQYCEIYNGHYKPFRQVLNPLTGTSLGTCAGHVYCWSKAENRKDGSYIIFNNNIDQLQEKFTPTFLGNEYCSSYHSILDIHPLLTIKPGAVYAVILDAKRKSYAHSKHAMGIRLINQNNGIELFDPIFGLFSFAHIQHFALWFPIFISYYCGTRSIFRSYRIVKIGEQSFNEECDVPILSSQNSFSPIHSLDQITKIFDYFQRVYDSQLKLSKENRRYLCFIEIQTFFYFAFPSLVNSTIDLSLLDLMKNKLRDKSYAFLNINNDSLEQNIYQEIVCNNTIESRSSILYPKKDYKKTTIIDQCHSLIEQRINEINQLTSSPSSPRRQL